MPKRWNENSFTGVSLLLVKYHGWRLISYDKVGAEQMPRTLNAYQKDLLSEYHTGFLNVLNQLKEPMMQNFRFF